MASCCSALQRPWLGRESATLAFGTEVISSDFRHIGSTFANLGDALNQYLADEMTERMISDLDQISAGVGRSALNSASDGIFCRRSAQLAHE